VDRSSLQTTLSEGPYARMDQENYSCGKATLRKGWGEMGLFHAEVFGQLRQLLRRLIREEVGDIIRRRNALIRANTGLKLHHW